MTNQYKAASRINKSVHALFIAGAVCVLVLAANAETTPIWVPWEHTFTNATPYSHPYRDVTLGVEYVSPGGATNHTYGFWDGGSLFRIHFMFPETGTWSWRTTCSDTGNTELHNQTGTVDVVGYTGTNVLYQKGYLKVSDNHRYLTYWNGDPFLWIGDTPWSVFKTATLSEWENYLSNRVSNKFDILMVHCGGQWVGNNILTNRVGVKPFTGTTTNDLQWNPAYWQYAEQMVQAANDHGIFVYVAAVRQPGPLPKAEVMETNLSEVELFSRNFAARMLNKFVLFSPIADDLWTVEGDVSGQTLADATPIQLVSAHPRFFLQSALDSYGKSFVDAVGLQTGEGWTFDPYLNEPQTPPSTPLAAYNAYKWPEMLYQLEPPKPVINQEGPYDHPIESSGRIPLPPRKAGYWSFLSGAKGHTYGCFGIWNWGVPISWFPTYDFETALTLPSVSHMKYQREFFDAIPWWTLEPHHELVIQPAEPAESTNSAWLTRIGLATSPARDLAVAYLPDVSNADSTIDMSTFPSAMIGKWFNPTNGSYVPINDPIIPTSSNSFTKPTDWEDAVLLLTVPSTPRLNFVPTGNGMQLSWTNSVGFKLQHTTNLAAASWVMWPGTLTTNGGMASASAPATEERTFFRLAWP